MRLRRACAQRTERVGARKTKVEVDQVSLEVEGMLLDTRIYLAVIYNWM